MRYAAWLNQWLELYVKQSVKPRTYDKYVSIIKLYIMPHLGNKDMNDLDGLVLQQFVIWLFEKGGTKFGRVSDRYGKKVGIGLSAGTVGDAVLIVQKSLVQAVSVGIISGHNADRICKPRQEENAGKARCFSEREQRAIEQYVIDRGDTLLYGILLALYTGLRIGELMALTWEDIDMKRAMLSVSKTCRDSWHHGYKKLVGTPKTASSYRMIPIPYQIMPFIRKMKRYSKCEYVISHRGRPVSVRSYQRTFARVLIKAGVQHLSFHSLRHTFATRAIENNMDIKTLADVMGHKSPAVTLTTYAHSLAPHKKSMMNKLGRILYSAQYLVEDDDD